MKSDKYYSVLEVAKLLKISRQAVIKQIKRPKMRFQFAQLRRFFINIFMQLLNGGGDHFGLSHNEICQIVVVRFRVKKRKPVFDRRFPQNG